MPTSGLATALSDTGRRRDVAPELGAFERHPLDRLIGVRPCVGDGRLRCAVTDRMRPPWVTRRPSCIAVPPWKTSAPAASAASIPVISAPEWSLRCRIVGRGDDDGDGRLVAHRDAGSGEVAVGGRSENREQVARRAVASEPGSRGRRSAR